MPKILLALTGVAALALAATAMSTPIAPYNLERAITAQRTLIDERPGDPAVHNDLGNLLLLARDHEGAAAAYARALEIEPDNVAALFNRALLLERQGERRAALKELKRVIDLDPRQAWAYYEIGKIYQGWHLEAMAERAYANAFRIEPRLANARTNPHVLDNELATRALLRAHERVSEELQSPRTYEEPARIAALMIDPPKEGAAEDRVAAETAGGGGFVRSTQTAPAAGETVAAETGDQETDDAEGPKTLTTRDLEPGRTTNQVGGSAGVAVVGGVPGRAGAAAGAAGGGRKAWPGTGARTAPTRPGFPGSSEPPKGAAPSAPPPAPPFDPGTDSTGRLEIELLPPAAGAVA